MSKEMNKYLLVIVLLLVTSVTFSQRKVLTTAQKDTVSGLILDSLEIHLLDATEELGFVIARDSLWSVASKEEFQDSLDGFPQKADNETITGVWTFDKPAEGAPIIIKTPSRSYIEFHRGSADRKVSVGILGGIEANLSYNMDYTGGVHDYYDTLYAATWLALNDNGFFIQFAPSGREPDIWSGLDYLIHVDSAGALDLKKLGFSISLHTGDPMLTGDTDTTKLNDNIKIMGGLGLYFTQSSGIDEAFIKMDGSNDYLDFNSALRYVFDARIDATQIYLSNRVVIDTGTLIYDMTPTYLYSNAPNVFQEQAAFDEGLLIQDERAAVYVKDNKFIIAWDDGGTDKYWYMDLTSTAATWTYTTSEP